MHPPPLPESLPCFAAALSGVEGAVEWVRFHNRIPFKSCHSKRGASLGGICFRSVGTVALSCQHHSNRCCPPSFRNLEIGAHLSIHAFSSVQSVWLAGQYDTRFHE